MGDQKTLPRRKLIRNLIGVSATATASSSVVQASSDNGDYPRGEFVQRLKDEYPTSEAEIIIETANRYATKVKRGELTRQEALVQCNEELIERDETDAITKDIRETRQFRRRISDTTTEATKATDSQTAGVSSDSVTTQATKSVPVSRYEFQFSYYGAASNEYRGSPGASPPSMGELADAIFYGGATTTVQLFGRFTTTSGTSGLVELSSKYFRFGNTPDASTTINLFVRETNNRSRIKRQSVENVVAGVKGNTFRVADFGLKDATQYDVGIELVGSVNNIALAYAASDFYLNDLSLTRRRLDVLQPFEVVKL